MNAKSILVGLVAVCLLTGFRSWDEREVALKATPFYEGTDVKYVGDATDRVNLWPLVYWRNPVGSVLWPLVSFADDSLSLGMIYSQRRQTGSKGPWDEFRFLDWMVWFDMQEHRHHIFPFYWDGPDYNALLPLWYYSSDRDKWTFSTLAGLAGVRSSAHDFRCSWAFPLWYEDNEGRFMSMLYGQSTDAWWLFPLCYKSSDRFLSPFYVQSTDGNKSTWFLPWSLTWAETTEHAGMRRSEGHALGALGGWKTRNGKLERLYALPLFCWRDDSSWLSLLGGQIHKDGMVNTFITPLAYITTGRYTGGGVFPLFGIRTCPDFDDRLALIDSATLPDCVKVAAGGNTGDPSFRSENSVYVLLQNFGHSIKGKVCKGEGSAKNAYSIVERRKCGNPLLLSYTSTHEVKFDLNTRAKLSDEENSKADSLFRMYYYEKSRDCLNGGESARHRVFWGLWDCKREGGNTELDVFPFFTYDKKENGYSKTSFMWRFFRNEYDPKTGRKVDLFFIPVWR